MGDAWTPCGVRGRWRGRRAPKVALPDVLLHALDKLVELLVDLRAAAGRAPSATKRQSAQCCTGPLRLLRHMSSHASAHAPVQPAVVARVMRGPGASLQAVLQPPPHHVF